MKACTAYLRTALVALVALAAAFQAVGGAPWPFPSCSCTRGRTEAALQAGWGLRGSARQLAHGPVCVHVRCHKALTCKLHLLHKAELPCYGCGSASIQELYQPAWRQVQHSALCKQCFNSEPAWPHSAGFHPSTASVAATAAQDCLATGPAAGRVVL